MTMSDIGAFPLCEISAPSDVRVGLFIERIDPKLTVKAFQEYEQRCPLILEKGGCNSWTALAKAAAEGNIPLVEYILKQTGPKQLSWGTKGKRTPLHCVFECQNKQKAYEASQLLIKAGARVNMLDAAGNAPLCVAAEKGHMAAVNLLLKHRAALPPNYQLQNKAKQIFEEINKKFEKQVTLYFLLKKPKGSFTSLAKEEAFPLELQKYIFDIMELIWLKENLFR